MEAVQKEDGNAKQGLDPFLFIKGPPGSGQSAALVEFAVRCARDEEINVVIVCPTGSNVYSFTSQLPDCPGIERIRVDTLQGVLNYKRPGKDGQVR